MLIPHIVHYFHVRTDDIYKYIEGDVEESFDTSNFELDRPLHKGQKSNWTNQKIN